MSGRDGDRRVVASNRWVRRRQTNAVRAHEKEAVASAKRARNCNRTTSVLVSMAVGEETPACKWIDALLLNVLAFTEPRTAIMLHVSSRLPCTAADMRRWTTSDLARGRMVEVNPTRLPTLGGHGSVLYAHLLNARFAAARWKSCCCYLVLQASNMLWVRHGMEARVERLRCSVGIEGWRRTDVDMPLLIAGYRRGSAGDVITARLYHNLTGSRYPMKAREIIALERSRQSISSQVRHAWSYHEGAFYPHATVLRFLEFLESTLSREQIMQSSNSPEEWWLQAWTLNREPLSTPIQPTTHQLCLRLNISQNGSQVTAS